MFNRLAKSIATGQDWCLVFLGHSLNSVNILQTISVYNCPQDNYMWNTIIYEWSKSKAMLSFGYMEQRVLLTSRQHFEAV